MISVLVAIGLYIISLFGPMVLLQSSNAGYRTIPSFYTFTTILVVLCSISGKRFSKIWVVAFILPLASSYQYGVVIKTQRDFENKITTMIHYDLLKHGFDKKHIFIQGRYPEAPLSLLIRNSQPFINSITPPLSRWTAESYFQGQGLINTQFHWDDEYEVVSNNIKEAICWSEAETIANNSIYSIYLTYGKIFILINDTKEKYCL